MVKKILRKIADALGGMSERNLLLVLSVVVGAGSGLAAVFLKQLIFLIHSLLGNVIVDRFGQWLYFILPGIGMFLSYLVVKYVVKDNISHGVTKVLLAMSKRDSKIKGHNMWSSVATSALTIGFGGSVGAEAPIVYTGAAIGSNVARMLHLPYGQMTLLLGCGAAGAVAGIFKAPLAGVLFTLEILLFNISATSILPLLASSVSATLVSYIFLGSDPFFPGAFEVFSMVNIPYYLLLGVFCGLVSLYFMRTSLFMEDRMSRVKSPLMRWGICATALGLLIFLFQPLYGEGYDSLVGLLNGKSEDVIGGVFRSVMSDDKWLVLVFFFIVMLLKVCAAALTNAGGGVGGTFGPTLITGALAGFVLVRMIGNLDIAALPEANFVLVGMAGLMAGVMQAPMTAIFLIAEITGGYTLLFPLIITSVISYATVRTTEKFSIYTKRIAAQGDLLTHDSDQAVLTLLKTADLIETDFLIIKEGQSLGDLVKTVSKSTRNTFPVVDDHGVFKGIVSLDDIREIMFDTKYYNQRSVMDFMKKTQKMVSVDEKMDSVMLKFETTNEWILPVVDKDGKYRGFVSKSKIFSSYREQLQQVTNE